MSLPDAIGISWGASMDQLREMSIPIEDKWPVWDQAIAVRTSISPNQLANTGSMILVFHQQYGLIKVHWASLPIQRDQTGARGIAAFQKVKAQLMATFGPSSQSKEETDVRLHGFYGDFYTCLQDETCGKWEAIWESQEGGMVILELIGLDNETGFLQITQQGPNVQHMLERHHESVTEPKQQI